MRGIRSMIDTVNFSPQLNFLPALKPTLNVLHTIRLGYISNTFFPPDSIFPRINNSRCVTYIGVSFALLLLFS